MRCGITSVSVSLAKTMTLALERGAQRGVVLDDPVVDHGDPARAIDVGMRVGFRGSAVRGPARVRYARGAGAVAAQAQPGGVHPADSADPAQERELVVARDADAPGVVSAILQALDPLDQHLGVRAFPA